MGLYDDLLNNFDEILDSLFNLDEPEGKMKVENLDRLWQITERA